MIPGDISAELASAIGAAVAAGELPPAAGTRAGAEATWRPAPRGLGGGPGCYATTAAFRLAQATGLGAPEISARLARRLRRIRWVAAASVTGGGYLTVTVTADALASLAVRVALAGDGCARSDALAGTRVSAPGQADLAGAASWAQAAQRVADAATGRLAAAAGAQVSSSIQAERLIPPGPATAPGPAARMVSTLAGAGPGSAAAADLGPVAAAVAFAGPDAIRYALARAPTGRAGSIDAATSVKQVLGNPFFAVCYAHADAAATLRWAADLGLDRGPPASFAPGLLAQPGEHGLLEMISWLPERVAAAARHHQPHELARHLERLTVAYLGCRESCPALPFRGRAAPGDAAAVSARLWLAAAAGAALGAGLRLLGIEPPQRV